MSDTSTIRQLQLEQAGNYIAYSIDALYLFECLLTFSQEVEVIWRRQWSVMTCIYAFTRYGSILLALFDVIPGSGFVDCEVSLYVDHALSLIQYLCFACFSALRVYALLDGRKLLAAIVFLLNLAPFAANLYGDVTSIVVLDSEICTTIPSLSEGFALRLSLAIRIAVIIGDVVVLLVTWSKTMQLYRESRHLGIKAPLATLLFRDGTLYFLILLVINILQVIEKHIPTLFILELSQSLLQTFTPIIICRFTLDLRQVKSPGSSWVSGNQSASLRFVGNAGGSLHFGGDDEEEGEEDVVGQPGQAEGSGVPIEDKEEDVSMSVTGHHSATQSGADAQV